MPAYEYRHVVGFHETSLVGNVYFSHYVTWQGHCRENFLHDHSPQVVELLNRREVAFFTANCSCEYIGDWGFSALDEVVIRMRLVKFRGGRMSLAFEYAKAAEPEKLVARGTQEVHC
jgi:enediyne biosynthesis thioesterase